MIKAEIGSGDPGPSSSNPHYMDIDQEVVTIDDSDDSIVYLDTKERISSALVDRGNVTWKESTVTRSEVVDDGHSLYYQGDTLLNPNIAEEPEMKVKLLTASEKLNRFIKLQGGVCESIFSESDNDLQECFDDITDKLSKPNVNSVNLHDLFRYQCQISTDMQPTYKSKFFDDASFNYSNAGIVWARTDKKIASEKASLVSVKNVLNKRVDRNVEPSSCIASTFEKLKIRISRALLHESSPSSPLIQGLPCSNSERGKPKQIETLVNEVTNTSSKDDISNLATERRKKKHSVDDSGHAHGSKSTLPNNDEQVATKKIRSSDNTSVPTTKQKSSALQGPSQIKPHSFLNTLNVPVAGMAVGDKSGTVKDKKKVKHIKHPKAQPKISSLAKIPRKIDSNFCAVQHNKTGITEINAAIASSAAAPSTSADNTDVLASIFSIIDNKEKEENIQGKRTKSSLWTSVNGDSRRQSIDIRREQDIVGEKSVLSTDTATASTVTMVHPKPTVPHVSEPGLTVFTAANCPSSSRSRPSIISNCRNNIDEPVNIHNANIAPSQQLEAEPCDVAFNVFSSSSSPFKDDGCLSAIPGLTPPRKSAPLDEIMESESGQNAISDLSTTMNKVESVLSEISLDLTDQFVGQPDDDLTEDPADDDETPSNLDVNTHAHMAAETSCIFVDDHADDDDHQSQPTSSNDCDYLLDDPADEMEENSPNGLEEPISHRSYCASSSLATELDEPTIHAGVADVSKEVDNSRNHVIDDLEEPDLCDIPTGQPVSAIASNSNRKAEIYCCDELEEPSPCLSPDTVQQAIQLHKESQMDESTAANILEEPSPCGSPTSMPQTNELIQTCADNLSGKSNCSAEDSVPFGADDLEEPDSYALPISFNMINTSLGAVGEAEPYFPDDLEEPSPCFSPSTVHKPVEVGPSGADDLEEPSPCASPSGIVQRLVQDNSSDMQYMEDPADELVNGIVPENDENLNADAPSSAINLKSFKVKREIPDDGYEGNANGINSTLGARLRIKREIDEDGYGENRNGYLLTREGPIYNMDDMEDPADDTLEIDNQDNSPAIDDLAQYRVHMDLAAAHLEDDPADDKPDIITLSDDESSEEDSDIEIIEDVEKAKVSSEITPAKPVVVTDEGIADLELKTTRPTEILKPLIHLKIVADAPLMKIMTPVIPAKDSRSQLTGELSKPGSAGLQPKIKICIPLKKIPLAEEMEYCKKKQKELWKTMCWKSLQSNEYKDSEGFITPSEQQKANREANRERDGYLSLAERQLQERLAKNPAGSSLKSIPIYRAKVVSRLNYPFDKCDGLWWPVIQPSDAIDIKILKEVESCDVINQMYNHSCYTHERQNMFLSDTDTERWRKNFADADKYFKFKEQDKIKGRFRNRIGFQRVSRIEDDEIGRENDRKNQEQEQKWLESLPNEMVYEVDRDELRRMRRDEEGCSRDDMRSHVEFNLRDEYTSDRFGGDRFKHNSAPEDWVGPPEKFYISANDRRDYLCVYTNWANRFMQDYMKSLNFPYTAKSVNVVRSSLQAAFCYQTQTSSFLCHPDSKDYSSIHQRSVQLVALADDMKRRKHVKLLNCLKQFELRDYEYAYWPIIWDSLVTFYKKYPFVSQMSTMLEGVLYRTFRLSARVAYREDYFKIYSERKRDHVEEMRERRRR